MSATFRAKHPRKSIKHISKISLTSYKITNIIAFICITEYKRQIPRNSAAELPKIEVYVVSIRYQKGWNGTEWSNSKCMTFLAALPININLFFSFRRKEKNQKKSLGVFSRAVLATLRFCCGNHDMYARWFFALFALVLTGAHARNARARLTINEESAKHIDPVIGVLHNLQYYVRKFTNTCKNK